MMWTKYKALVVNTRVPELGLNIQMAISKIRTCDNAMHFMKPSSKRLGERTKEAELRHVLPAACSLLLSPHREGCQVHSWGKAAERCSVILGSSSGLVHENLELWVRHRWWRGQAHCALWSLYLILEFMIRRIYGFLCELLPLILVMETGSEALKWTNLILSTSEVCVQQWEPAHVFLIDVRAPHTENTSLITVIFLCNLLQSVIFNFFDIL